MARISKPPEVRRQEILDTAMELFAEKGYEDTSMADIARRMGVVQGLCYRYFDSKRVLFREAMEQYVRECCAAGLPIIHDRSRTIRQRLDDMEMTMEKTMKIEGMMCGHCEASVKKALEALAEVEAAEVSHEKGTAVVTLRSEVSDEVLKKAVEEKDYTVVEIR